MKHFILILFYLGLSTAIFASDSEAKTFSPVDSIDSIIVNVRDRDVNVSLSKDNKVHVAYYESKNEYYDISVSDENVLSIRSKSDKKWIDYFGKKASGDVRKIFIEIPSDYEGSLSIATTNEDIRIMGLLSLEDINLDNNNGDISFESINVENSFTLNAKNGDISGTIIGGYDDYEIQTKIKKGDSNLPREKAGGDKHLFVSCNNGDIDIKFVK